MKPVKKQKKSNARVPFSSPPTKKYPFRTPIPPCSIVRRVKTLTRATQKELGRTFRIGYYSWQDGLDCIWLVNKKGEYEQTVDHDYLAKYFEIVELSKERARYGKNRPPIGSLKI